MATKKTPAKVEPKRVFNDQKEVVTDTFKLLPEKMKKNISWNEKRPVLEGVEHSHFFHTVTSKGRTQTQATATGGHTHDVTVEMDDNGNLVAKVGPARRVKGGELKYNDRHTHEAIYLRSANVEVTAANADAMKVINAQMNREAELLSGAE